MSVEIPRSSIIASVKRTKQDEERDIKRASLDELQRMHDQQGDLAHPLVLTRIEQLEMAQSNDNNSPRHQSEELVLYEPDPWSDAVDGATVLSDVRKALLSPHRRLEGFQSLSYVVPKGDAALLVAVNGPPFLFRDADHLRTRHGENRVVFG